MEIASYCRRCDRRPSAYRPDFEGSEVAIKLDILPHESALVTGRDDERVILGATAFGGNVVTLVNGSLKRIAERSLWVVHVLHLNLGDTDRLGLWSGERLLPSRVEVYLLACTERPGDHSLGRHDYLCKFDLRL